MLHIVLYFFVAMGSNAISLSNVIINESLVNESLVNESNESGIDISLNLTDDMVECENVTCQCPQCNPRLSTCDCIIKFLGSERRHDDRFAGSYIVMENYCNDIRSKNGWPAFTIVVPNNCSESNTTTICENVCKQCDGDGDQHACNFFSGLVLEILPGTYPSSISDRKFCMGQCCTNGFIVEYSFKSFIMGLVASALIFL